MGLDVFDDFEASQSFGHSKDQSWKCKMLWTWSQL